MKTRNILMIVAAALVGVVALVLTIYGVATHSEPVFTDDEKSWDRRAFPLQLRAHRYTAVGDKPLEAWQVTSLEDALSVTNSRLGFKAFEMAAEGENVDVHVDIGLPYDDEWEAAGGQYRLLGRGLEYTECQIVTSNNGTAELLFWTLQHELGHCLGLAHDPFSMSIMYAEQRPVDDLSNRPWITDDDRKALRERYAPTD